LGDILGSDGSDDAGYCLLCRCVFWHVTYNLAYRYWHFGTTFFLSSWKSKFVT